MDEVDAHGVGVGQAVGSSAVGVGWGRRERMSALSLAVPFRYQPVCVGGGELQPTLDADVVFAYYGNILERLVVGVDGETRGRWLPWPGGKGI